MIYKPNRKVQGQDLLDFTLTNYGKIDNLYQVISENGLDDIEDFEDIADDTILKVPGKIANKNNTFFKRNKFYIKTDE